MIVIVGSPIAAPATHGIGAGGLGAAIAIAAAREGAAVEVVGRVGEDAAGDQVLLALAAARVGHVAILREPGRPTPAAPPGVGESPSPDGPALGEALVAEDAFGDEAIGANATGDHRAIEQEPAGLSVDAADLELALRYVPDYRVLVLAADLDPTARSAVVAATAWSGAQLVALLAAGAAADDLPETATVLERPPSDPDGAFAAMVAAYAVALDGGSAPADAFAAAQRSGAWAAVPD
jgi:hypothetical protein